jgi:orotate phosphoribosyltransferase
MLLAAGGAVALLASEIAPAILYPDDRYPVAFGWTVGGIPVAVVTWLAATAGGWAAGRAGTASPA